MMNDLPQGSFIRPSRAKPTHDFLAIHPALRFAFALALNSLPKPYTFLIPLCLSRYHYTYFTCPAFSFAPGDSPEHEGPV